MMRFTDAADELSKDSGVASEGNSHGLAWMVGVDSQRYGARLYIGL